MLAADVISRFGDSLDAIAYSWIMYEITGSESLMALIIGLNYIPTIFLQPIIGTLIDRVNKRMIMVVADLLRFVVVLLFVALYLGGRLTPLLIAALTMLTSTIEAFRMPARNAITPQLLEPAHYTLGKAANYSFSRISQLLGYVVSGGLVINFGLMPLTVFQTPYVSDYLNMGAGMLSYIKILMMLGMMAGAFVTPKLLKFQKGHLCIAAGIGMGMYIVCMYIAPSIAFTAGKMALLTLSMLFVGVGDIKCR